MARLRSNFLNGTLSALASNVATTLTSAAFANLPAISAGVDEMTLVLDPTGSAGAPEVVKVTAHTAASTTVTVTRGQEGTSARQHASGVAWRHTATASDFVTVCTSSTRPTTGLYEGRRIYETDTDETVIYDGSVWRCVGPVVCTSATRPANPYEGLLIYETDTNKVVAYTGTDWAPRDAGGTLGYAQSTATQGPFTAGTDLTGLSTTVTVGAGRRIRITAHVFANSAVTGDVVFVNIMEGGTTLLNIGSSYARGAWNQTITGSVVLTPSAGSHTYKLHAGLWGGTGPVNIAGGATTPNFILVEDIGAA